MKEIFLREVAQKVYHQHKEQLSELYIVLPSRRACMYFKQYLGEVMENTIFSPAILSMEGFAKQLSNLQKADGVTLLFELFETYRELEPEVTLEKFAPLGNSMLRDFNMIDNNLNEQQTEEMFTQLHDIKAIERWAEELGTEPETLKERQSKSLTEFFAFWENLSKTYWNFRAKLEKKGIAYGGLAFRQAYNRLEDAVKELGIKKVVFAGFSQVSTVEQQMMERLTKMKLTEHYFDADRFYLDNTEHEAGHFLRQFENSFAKDHPDLQLKYIGQEEKQVEIITVSSNPTQAKLVGQILQQNLSDQDECRRFSTTINHTGILLPDESLLNPLLYSLPDIEMPDGTQLADKTNITMGIAFQHTPLFDLIQAIFKMQDGLKEKDGVMCAYFKDILNIVRHPYFQYSNTSKEYREIAEGIQKEITEQGLIFMPLGKVVSWGDSMPLYEAIFQSWNKNYRKAIDQLMALTEALVDVFRRREDPLKLYDKEEGQSFENELLMKFFTTLTRLQDILSARKEQLSIQTFRLLMMELLKNVSIPFTGRPIAPLQIMGMLESRALDFEHVIILSCNEGKLPMKKVAESIIPYDLRVQSGMPTYKHNDIAFAYTFYRLFHRAKKITLIHTDPTANKDGGEISRFLVQLQEELACFPEYKISVEKKLLELELPDLTEQEGYRIEKDAAIVELLKEQIRKGFSPSLINRYIRNPLEFLEMRVLGIQEGEELEESLDYRTFGTLLHETIEQLFKHQVGQVISREDLDAMTKGKTISDALSYVSANSHDKDVRNKDMSYGKNYLLKKVAERLVFNFMSLQRDKEAGFYLVAQETFHDHTIHIPLPDGTSIPFRLAGMADRIDIIGNHTIRVVDYKTGSYLKEKLNANTWSDLLHDPEKEKIVQLLAYKYILIQNLEHGNLQHMKLPVGFDTKNCQVQAGFYFFRKLSDGFVQYKLADEPTDRKEFIAFAEQFFGTVIRDMLDSQKDFTETPPFEQLANSNF
ncbi:PD-(D/E)XK nuclease family protein [Limibacter armeniacum]|uniref:PD-(D/E)XK nuclease family protein n=1 Tax=Limibacter armeniacum TaxID=466084 RepID=UPI002FE5C12D